MDPRELNIQSLFFFNNFLDDSLNITFVNNTKIKIYKYIYYYYFQEGVALKRTYGQITKPELKSE